MQNNIKKYFFTYNSEISIANIWINGGSNFDKKNKKGTNHLLCALIIRSCKGFDNFSFSEYINSYGAELNHEVYEDGIFFTLKTIKKFFKKLYPLLIKTVEEPNLDEKDFSICKNFAINNINKSKENLFHIVYENWRKIVYINHPYSFNSEGYINDIKNITYENIKEEYKDFQFRKKFLLSNFKIDNMLELDSRKNYNKYIPNKSQIIQTINSTRFVSKFIESKQVIITLGNQTCSYASKDYLALKILESHLSFGMSSLLFKLFRENNSLTYDVGIYNPIRKSSAPFLIYISASDKNSYVVLKLLIKLWKSLSKIPITFDELKLAKIKLNATLLNSYQTLEELTLRKVQLLGFGMNPFYEQQLSEMINKINPEDIVKASSKYLANPYLSIVGEEKTCKKLEKTWLKSL